MIKLKLEFLRAVIIKQVLRQLDSSELFLCRPFGQTTLLDQEYDQGKRNDKHNSKRA
jgi:hypothetical protein